MRKDKIREFIESIESSEDTFVPQFCHNLKNNKKVYYGGPYYDKEELVEAIDTLLFGKWLSSGHKVNEFELEFSKKIQVKNSLMVNSGSSANLVAISAAKQYYKWNDGDEIILSVVGFPTTLNPIIQNSLKPVFIDIEFDTLNFDLDLVEKSITSKTKAIFVSPVLGNPPDIDRIVNLCEKYKLVPILDCCDSLGTLWKGRHIAEYFDISTYSFYPAHHITTGEGGMVCSNNDELIRIARSFAWWGRGCYCVGTQNLSQRGVCGKRFDRWIPELDYVIDHKYLFTQVGYNLKPLDIQGAIGLVQLKKLDEIHDKRVKNHDKIVSMLSKIKGLSFATVLKDSEVSWFGVPIICKDNITKSKLVNYFESNGIQTRNYFAGNILNQPAYKEMGNRLDYPLANEVLNLVFFLGCSPTIDQEKLNYLQEKINEYS
jgi:CDP-6-deoxy-D-xylo-4-hexulose-3-dehydrase